jgi:nucleoside-diphosphate-sugar epimerase
MQDILILGHGYVGSALASKLPHAMCTNSSVEKANSNASIYFNLKDRNSWNNLPAATTIIWTFAATPLDLVEEIYQNKLQQDCDKLLVYASSSCYQLSSDNNLVTEKHSLSYSKPRVAGEEYLRNHNAAILVLSGIYGPERQPLNWLQKGLVRSLQKKVNLIHRDDIVDITCYLLTHNCVPYGQRLNITDGMSRRWSDIADHYGVHPDEISGDIVNNHLLGKSVSNQKLRQLLPPEFVFRRLY